MSTFQLSIRRTNGDEVVIGKPVRRLFLATKTAKSVMRRGWVRTFKDGSSTSYPGRDVRSITIERTTQEPA